MNDKSGPHAQEGHEAKPDAEHEQLEAAVLWPLHLPRNDLHKGHIKKGTWKAFLWMSEAKVRPKLVLASPDARADTEAAPALVDRLASARPRAMPIGVASANAAITVQKRLLVAPASPSMRQSPTNFEQQVIEADKRTRVNDGGPKRIRCQALMRNNGNKYVERVLYGLLRTHGRPLHGLT